MKDERFNELVSKFLTRDINENEKNELNIFLQVEQFNKEFELFVNNWNNQTREQINFDTNKALDKLTARLTLESSSEKTAVKNYRFFSPIFLKAAAVIAFALIVSSLAIYYSGIFESKKTIIAWYEKATKMGEKSIVTLLDGTAITLNADSKIKYPRKFDGKTREVFLQGEAYFEVAPDPLHPFIVHAANISTTVLGTRFNVSSFENEDEISVSLVEGMVKVTVEKNQKGEVILSPTQQLVYDKKNEKSSVRVFDSEQEIGWKDNNLVFEKQLLREIFVALERSYGVKFELADESYANWKVTANFKNASLWTVIETIKNLTHLKYKTSKENGEIKSVRFYDDEL